MPETWIDEHTGNETVARPGFRAELRAEFARETALPEAPRRAPWKIITWSVAAAAAVAVATAVVTKDDRSGRVGPVTSDSLQIESVPSTADSADPLRDQLVDVEWIIVSLDGVVVNTANPPSFVLQSDGRVVGFDGCNQYGYDLATVGGWTLTGDTLTLDQTLVSTAMACIGPTDAPVPAVIAVTNGTRVALDSSGLLRLTSPSGRVYTARGSSTVESFTPELVVPAEGGPLLVPTPLVTVDDNANARVALLPDRIVVLQSPNTVRSFDRAGNAMSDTTLETYVWENTSLALGGHDGTLYLVENSDTENSQTIKAFRLVGNVWQVVDSTVVEDNNDGVYAVTGAGLVIGDSVILTAPTPRANAPVTGWAGGTSQVLRTDADGTSTTWDIVEQFENFGIPAATHPFGDGVLYLGNPNGSDEQRYIGILRRTAASEFFRLNGWALADVDASAALFVKESQGVFTLGLVESAPRIEWALGKVLEFPLNFSSVDKVLTGVNPVLGQPTADSGWFTVQPAAPGDEDCLAGAELRVLHWGDLTIAFKKTNTADGLQGELLWSWVVGDIRGSGFDSLREPDSAPPGMPTGLRTEDGVGVGSSTDALRRSGELMFSDIANADGSRSGFVQPSPQNGAAFRAFVVDADGIVTGFGTTLAFC